MGENPRARKLADRIQEIIAKRIERGMRDPRLGFVTITDVRVTGDLQHASVFYTVYGSDQERADSAAALEAAKGMFRSEVGKNITARLTPSLEFIHDALPENAKHLDELLAQARERDESIEALKSTATYAGDEDPYVKPRVIAEDDDQI
ncbi:30S ribosome-binding factor RbfA [Mycetocola manganoxydans]|uniref:Ribosome-binding factor A n=1 Tax=Mycetocola manganoxydans TaxID=699879 RepID=A0A3L6ZPG1_9MICO|nr:30S ribosome-binding factor RbfA [Mycetocola manganoxydans]RLP69844.1 30S ribosome-binding factor RbfA [Mycetocola manganoxydans]GHD50298.1 ribosome-binding factor A [Mycetocola manganoxydans]